MRRRLTDTADVVPVLVVLGLLVWLVAVDAGLAITRWAPAGLFVLALLGARLVVDRPDWGQIPRGVAVAVAALALYAAWSALSIAWAGDRGIAWEGADRTVLFAALFALGGLWPLTHRQAGGAIAAWVLAIAVFAAVTFAGLAASSDPAQLISFDRLPGPAGYFNASAALWLMAAWPAIVLAAGRLLPWWVRGPLAGCAVLLCDVALLSQSRGSLIAVPLTAAVILVLAPGRVRVFFTLAAVAAGVAATARAVLAVGDANTAHRGVAEAVDAALRATVLAAIGVGVLATLAAVAEARRPPSAAMARTLHRAGAAVAAALVVIAAAGALVVVGNPASAAGRAWDSFKGGYGDLGPGVRLTSGLGSNRYDFYRVGLDVLADHPLAGIGADNYKAEYLVRGRSQETPTYPHSVEIRALVSTGAIGALLLLAFAAAGAAALATGMRRAGPEGAAASAAGAGAFVYWAAHGSGDWLWEFAGLGGPAFFLLALGCAALGRREAAVEHDAAGRAGTVAGAVLCAIAFVALLPPWLAQRDVEAAGRAFAADPGRAIADLRQAQRTDRLDHRPALVEGSAWLRLGDRARARAALRAGLARHSGDPYALLVLGSIASADGDRATARRLLRSAVASAPRDPTARQALTVVQRGRTVDLDALQRAIIGTARVYTRG